MVYIITYSLFICSSCRIYYDML